MLTQNTQNKSNSDTEVQQTTNIDTSKIQHNNLNGDAIFRKQLSFRIYEIKDVLQGRETQIKPIDQVVDEGC